MAKASIEKSITSKINELNSAVEWFYGDEFSLDQATEKYQQAVDLVKEIEQDLDGLKNQIDIIDKDFTKD